MFTREKTSFSYQAFASNLRTALLKAKASGLINESSRLHLLDNGSELGLFWTHAGFTQACWVGYSDNQAVVISLNKLLADVEAEPTAAVNTLHSFMLDGAVMPAEATSLLDFARPVLNMLAPGETNPARSPVVFVGCDVLDPDSPISTLVLGTYTERDAA
jgi:cellulase/cellobiase CelA1